MNNIQVANKSALTLAEFTTETGQVLTADTVKNYLVSGNGNVTDQEVLMFIELCKAQHLNPFIREAYLIKFGSSPANIVVGKDVFVKRAHRNPDYEGPIAIPPNIAGISDTSNFKKLGNIGNGTDMNISMYATAANIPILANVFTEIDLFFLIVPCIKLPPNIFK